MGPKKDRTRERILEAGRRFVAEHGLPEAMDVKLAEVLKAEGSSTGAAYNIWRNQEHFQRDLALHVAHSFSWADTHTVVDAIADLPADASLEDWVVTVAETYFPLFVANLDFFSVLRFWSIREPRAELEAAIRRGYDLVHEDFAAFYRWALDHHGYEPVEPMTVEDITTMVTAAIEGCALRHRFQPERLDGAERHLFTELMLTIARAHTRPIGKKE